MNNDRYKRAFDKMEPDAGFEKRLAAQLLNRPKTRHMPLTAVAAACVVMLLGAAILAGQLWPAERTHVAEPSPINATVKPNPSVTDGGVLIPQMELPKESSGAADMIGLIVYKGKIYTQTDTYIPPEFAKPLLGEKIGRTKGNIDEWSKQDDYAAELASSIGPSDVYTVKGYDSSFRIMTYDVYDGQIQAAYYECLNGIEVKSGTDVFGQMNIVGNVQSAGWERFGVWDTGGEEFRRIEADDTLQRFLGALHAAKPVEREKLQGDGRFEGGEQTQKFLMLKLKDNSVVRLRLFNDGYVLYGHAPVFFQVATDAFAPLWNELK